jgi:dolichol kinase
MLKVGNMLLNGYQNDIKSKKTIYAILQFGVLSIKNEAKYVSKRYFTNAYFWFALLIILATLLISVASFLRFFRLSFYIGPFRFSHWLGLIGTFFVAFFTPTYHILKRRSPRRGGALTNVHCFGNLLSVMLISVHFSQQMSRPAESFPDLGTGLILYFVMIILVATGFFQRFQIAKSHGRRWRFIHVSVTITFYLVIIIHILHGLEII